MSYIVLEFQTNADGTVGVLPANTYDDRLHAEAKYHEILSVAAVSAVPIHAAIMVDNAGRFIASQYYEHVTGMTGGTEDDV